MKTFGSFIWGELWEERQVGGSRSTRRNPPATQPCVWWDEIWTRTYRWTGDNRVFLHLCIVSTLVLYTLSQRLPSPFNLKNFFFHSKLFIQQIESQKPLNLWVTSSLIRTWIRLKKRACFGFLIFTFALQPVFWWEGRQKFIVTNYTATSLFRSGWEKKIVKK